MILPIPAYKTFGLCHMNDGDGKYQQKKTCKVEDQVYMSHVCEYIGLPHARDDVERLTSSKRVNLKNKKKRKRNRLQSFLRCD